MESLFQGTEHIRDAVPEQVRQALDQSLALSADPSGDLQRWAITAFLSDRYRRPIAEISRDYYNLRDAAGAQLGVKGKVTDAGMYLAIGDQLQKERGQRDMLAAASADLVGSLIPHLDEQDNPVTAPETFDAAFERFQKSYGSDPRFDPAQAPIYRTLLAAQWRDAHEVAQQLTKPVSALSEYFRDRKRRGAEAEAEVRQGTGFATLLRMSALDELSALSEDRQNAALALAARQVGQRKEGAISEPIRRAGRAAGELIGGALRGLTFQSRDPLERKLDGVADGTIDPLVSGSTWAHYLGKVTEQAPEFLAATTGVGLGADYLATKDRMRQELETQGAPALDAELTAAVKAVPATMARFISRELFLNARIPVVGRLLGETASGTQKFAAIAGSEAAINYAISNTLPLAEAGIQSLAARLDSALPGVEWKPIVENVKDSQGEFAAWSLGAGLIGGGIGTFRDQKRGKAFMQNPDAMRRMKFGEEDIRRVMDAKGYGDIEQAFQTGFRRRDQGLPPPRALPPETQVSAMRWRKPDGSMGESVQMLLPPKPGEARPPIQGSPDQLRQRGWDVPDRLFLPEGDAIATTIGELQANRPEAVGIGKVGGFPPELADALRARWKKDGIPADEIERRVNLAVEGEEQFNLTKPVFDAANGVTIPANSTVNRSTIERLGVKVRGESLPKDVPVEGVHYVKATETIPDGQSAAGAPEMGVAAAPADHAASDAFDRAMARIGRDSESLHIVPPESHAFAEFMREMSLGPGAWNAVRGYSVPRTSAYAPESGNAIVRYASASGAAPHLSELAVRRVLGPLRMDGAFRLELGAVLVEDRLRAIRRGLEKAGKADEAARVTTLVGEGKPFASENHFQVSLRDPQIREAIEAHKQYVQEAAKTMHEETGGQLAAVGEATGAFVNLRAAGLEESGTGFAVRGSTTTPLRKRSRFSKRATGAAESYVLDYDVLARRMIEGNLVEVAKRDMYEQLKKDKLAIELEPGAERPEIQGLPTVQFQIERRGQTLGSEQSRTLIRNLWVHPEVAPELRQALNLDGAVRKGAASATVQMVNRAQLAGPVDGTFHVANILSAIAGTQGGQTLLTDLARKFPGVNIADALVRISAKAVEVVRNDDRIVEKLSELSTIGALREGVHGRFFGRFIGLMDRAGRLVLNDMFDNLVERGLAKNSEEARREFVNQVGQYNGRLQGQFQRFMKEVGISPFVVAGRNFNRLAFRRLTLSPGFEARNGVAALQTRAVELAGTMLTLVVVPSALNYLITGKIAGRPGTPYGAIDTGRDDERGRHIVIDPAQWTGLRRGLRISGLNALVRGLQRGEPGNEYGADVFKDVLGGLAHPWAGPVVRVASVALTGYSPTGFQEAPLKERGLRQVAERLKVAARELNPVLGAFLEEKEQSGSAGAGLTSAVQQLGTAAGIKYARPFSAEQQVYTLVDQFREATHTTKPEADYGVSAYQPYVRALKGGTQKEVEKALAELLQEKHPGEIAAYFRRYARQMYTGSQQDEARFLAGLSDEERATYVEARRRRVQLAEIGMAIVARRAAAPKP